jgi:Tol biopolymer transport system component
LVTIQEPLSMCSNLGWLTLTEKTFQPLLPVTDCINTAAWSPTGRRIAASSADGGHGGYPGFGVRIFDLTGPGQHLIVEREIEPGVLAAASHIAWSPDEAWLAFSLETGERNLSAPKLRLHLSRPDGRELQTLTHNTGGQADFPVWATRNTLYYALHEADTGDAGIYLYDLVDQTHTLILPGRNLQPLNLSPDGEFLLYHDAGKLKLWSLSAAKVISLTDSPATFVGWLAGPAAH